MSIDVPAEVYDRARDGFRLSPQTFIGIIQQGWPTLWSVCQHLADEVRESGDRSSYDISGLPKMDRLHLLHGIAGTAVRRELGAHFGCRFFMPHGSAIAALPCGDSDSPPSTRIANILECDLPLGYARISKLAETARSSENGFAVDEPPSISDRELWEILRIHAVEPYRKVIETLFAVELAFHAPCVSAARCRGVASAPFKAFVSIEESVLHSSLPPPTD